MPRLGLLLLALTASACIGDRWWILQTTAPLPHTVPTECIRTSLSRLPGVDSVRVVPLLITPTAVTDSIVAGMQFGVAGRNPDYGWITQRTRTDSSASLTTSWIVLGGKPPRDSIEYHKQLHATVLRAVSGDCAHIDPRLRVVEGDHL